MELNYKEFIAKGKGMIIAPAGCGKTHTIGECIKHTEGKQLVLTHTHAGIASIKEKLKKTGIDSKKVQIETISGFAQKYVNSFCKKEIIPDQEDGKKYYPFLIAEATRLLKLKPVANIIKLSYTGLFVDEYQDCTLTQHNFILALSDILPTRILGDPLQGIFDFETDVLVDLLSNEQMGHFLSNTEQLSQPRRWEGINDSLGVDLLAIRKLIEIKNDINLDNFKSITCNVVVEKDLYNPTSSYSKGIWNLLKEDSVLLLHPNSTSVEIRKRIIGRFKGMKLIEAIDDKAIYQLASSIDNCVVENRSKTIRAICYTFFDKTTLNTWFNNKGLINKKRDAEKEIIRPVGEQMDNFVRDGGNFSLYCCIEKVSNLPGISIIRREWYKALMTAIKESLDNGLSVKSNLIRQRNITRSIGRKIHGRAIGTTLLTKGLEFDTVVLLDAFKFDSKNLYVALTRARKKLVLFTNSKTLSPHKNNT